MSPELPETDVQTVGGEPWARLATSPRLIAESFRRPLEAAGVPTLLRTPFQWVMGSPVIEIETGGYQGEVGLYVPEVALARARSVMRAVSGEDAAQTPEGDEPGSA